MKKGIFTVLLRLIRIFFGFESIIILLRSLPSNLIKTVLLEFGAEIGENSSFQSPLIIHNAKNGFSNLKVGANCYFGKDILLDLKDIINIESNVTVSMRCSIITHFDRGKSLEGIDDYKSLSESITIKEKSYLGAGSIILNGADIGSKSLIGAGSVVINNIPDGVLAAGVPAKVKKTIVTGE